MEGALRRSLGSQAQHTHTLEDHTWYIQQSTTTHTKHIHNIQQQNSNYTQTHCELFHQTIHKHTTHKTNIHINRETHTIQGYNITLTTSQVQEAIKQCKNNNSLGSDKRNIRRLKHIGPLGLAFLTSMLKNCSQKKKFTSHMEVGKHSPYPKTQQRHKQGYLIQAHIHSLSNCKDTGEEPSSPHNSKHTNATRVQNTTLYSDGITHTK